MTHVRTVLGDITPDALGVTNAHDHLFFCSPTLPGQELDDAQLARAAITVTNPARAFTLLPR